MQPRTLPPLAIDFKTYRDIITPRAPRQLGARPQRINVNLHDDTQVNDDFVGVDASPLCIAIAWHFGDVYRALCIVLHGPRHESIQTHIVESQDEMLDEFERIMLHLKLGDPSICVGIEGNLTQNYSKTVKILSKQVQFNNDVIRILQAQSNSNHVNVIPNSWIKRCWHKNALYNEQYVIELAYLNTKKTKKKPYTKLKMFLGYKAHVEDGQTLPDIKVSKASVASPAVLAEIEKRMCHPYTDIVDACAILYYLKWVDSCSPLS
jgi:hypothetical protein